MARRKAKYEQVGTANGKTEMTRRMIKGTANTKWPFGGR